MLTRNYARTELSASKWTSYLEIFQGPLLTTDRTMHTDGRGKGGKGVIHSTWRAAQHRNYRDAPSCGLPGLVLRRLLLLARR